MGGGGLRWVCNSGAGSMPDASTWLFGRESILPEKKTRLEGKASSLKRRPGELQFVV